MEGINVINSNVDGGISGLKNQGPRENSQKQFTQDNTPEARSSEDDGVVVKISKQAEEQLKRDQAVQAEATREIKKQANKQFAEQAAPPPPPPPPPAKEKESLSFFGQNQERIETRKAEGEQEFKSLQRKLDGFADYTTRFLARLAGVQTNLQQQTAAEPEVAPAPQDLVKKLDLLA